MVEFGAADVGVETLVGSGVEVMIAAITNGSFDKISVRVGNTSLVTITG